MREVEILAAVERALIEHFAQQPVRASMSFLGVAPIEILRFEPIPGERAYVSLGMARQPMTAAGDLVVADDGPRAELMLHVRDPVDEFSRVWRQLAVLAAAPTVEGVVYASGMSVDLGEPLAPGSHCTGVLVTSSAVRLPDAGATPVEVLQVVPATSAELGWCRVRGSEALRQRWAEAGIDSLDLARRGVELG